MAPALMEILITMSGSLAPNVKLTDGPCPSIVEPHHSTMAKSYQSQLPWRALFSFCFMALA